MALTTTINLERVRGDTFPFQFVLQEDGAAKDLTGSALKMTVDPSPTPPDNTTKEFELNAVITDAANGKFEFRPTAGNMDLTIKTWHYDVQLTDTGGFITTVIKGKLDILQDITK